MAKSPRRGLFPWLLPVGEMLRRELVLACRALVGESREEALTNSFVASTKVFVECRATRESRAPRSDPGQPQPECETMARPARKGPTDAELEILDVLWEHGPGTVREVHQRLSERRGARGTGQTTVLKLMQIMTDKGLLERDESVRPQVFRTARGRSETQQALLGQLADRAFSGSAGKLVLAALSSRRATPDEQRRIRELLDRLEAEGDDAPGEDVP